jgi:hypothetical protein
MSAHAYFWDITEPIEPGWRFDSGYDGEEAAHRAASELQGLEVKVVRLATVEHELSLNDPAYRPEQNVRSMRWCVLCREKQS